MVDRVVSCICPHCGKLTDVFVYVGFDAYDVCENCGETIIFNESGHIEDRELSFLESRLLMILEDME